MRSALTALAVLLLMSSASIAGLHTEVVEYRDGDAVLEGYLAYDDSIKEPRPGVLVVHEWYGLNDYARMRTEQVAGLGYVAFAADIYGKGVRAGTPDEAAHISREYLTDRQLLRRRAAAALKVLKEQPLADASRTAAIGYCFGGATVLELARSGADVLGVASFHGLLATPTPEDAKNIKGKVLVLQGANDPYVKAEEVRAFQEEMRAAEVDWQMNIYGGAVHSFTNPASGSDPSRGIAYNERAARRSWEALRLFLDEIFKKR